MTDPDDLLAKVSVQGSQPRVECTSEDRRDSVVREGQELSQDYIRFEDRNLPPDFDGPVPTAAEFRDAINNALADEISFILLNSDAPHVISSRLPRLLERMRAAMALKGPHQARTIRLVTQIPARYWLASYRLKAWGDLLLFAISIARDLKDDKLFGEVLRAQGTYLALYSKCRGAGYAFDWSLQVLDSAVDENTRLLLELEKFNVNVLDLPRHAVLAQAEDLLAAARKLHSDYFQGRVFHALARYFRGTRCPKEAFMYGQQALCYYWTDAETWQDLIAQVMLTMNVTLRQATPSSEDHQQRIVNFLDEMLPDLKFNPLTLAKIVHEHAIQHYENKRYDQAKQFILKAGIQYRLLSDQDGWARVQHIWGQAQRNLGQWSQAERHLSIAAALYNELENDRLYILARLSHALVPYEQHDWRRALRLLSEVRQLADRLLLDANVREKQLQEIDKYLEDVRSHLT